MMKSRKEGNEKSSPDVEASCMYNVFGRSLS